MLPRSFCPIFPLSAFIYTAQWMHSPPLFRRERRQRSMLCTPHRARCLTTFEQRRGPLPRWRWRSVQSGKKRVVRQDGQKNKPASTYLIHRGDMDEYVRKAKKEVERVGEMGSAMQVVHDIVQATTAGEAEKKVADSAKSLIAHTSSSLPLLTSASTSVNSSMAEVEKAKNEKWIPSLVEASRECEESVRLSEKIREELDYWWRQGEAELVEWMEVDGMNVQEWRQEWNRLTNNDV
mmetsp:Transcript_11944/g.32313  ORF Transcript_11944/g.32313 Transcript_11944/m.32313 type:complete len:236 (-) Transcript_11944:82-789(-)